MKGEGEGGGEGGGRGQGRGPGAGPGRLRAAFLAARARGEGALVAYLMAGDPTPVACRPYFEAVLEHADVLEIGVPFSDPVADGPTIQRAGVRALAAGTRVDDALRLASELRARSDKPIVLMTYANPVFRRGWAAFGRAAQEAGADAIILPDVPLEESDEPRRAFAASGLDLVQLASPATSPDRIARLAQATGGFLYVVSSYGVTGARSGVAERTRQLVATAKKAAGDVPVAVGFGVAAPADVRALLEAGADGAVVGSALVARVEKGEPPAEVGAFAGELKRATRR